VFSKNTSSTQSKAEPKFIARKYHRQTGAYLELYKMGRSWEDWQRKVETFDINNRIHVQAYNKWIGNVCEQFDHQPDKLPSRPRWTSDEIRVLRAHFNDIIEKQGLIAAYKPLDWKQMHKKITAVGNTPQNEDSVETMVERDIFRMSDERMGMKEWIQFGMLLYLLKETNPGLDIPKNILFPGRVIPMENIKDRLAGTGDNDPPSEYWSPGDGSVRVPKLSVKVVDGQVVVEDIFGGSIVARYGLMDHYQSTTQGFDRRWDC
jgi:hypothetical protein